MATVTDLGSERWPLIFLATKVIALLATGDRRFVYLLIYSCGDERYPKRKIIFENKFFLGYDAQRITLMMHDATKITENFSVAFSWRLSQGCRLSTYGGFRHFWRTLVLICLEIQLNSTLHGFVLRWERSYKVFVICRGCLGGGLVAQLLFT